MSPKPAEPRTHEPFPDILALNLAELRTIRHPVLSEVLEDLRAGAAQPGDVLWGYGSAF
jgi:FXSXX-COOH protein